MTVHDDVIVLLLDLGGVVLDIEPRAVLEHWADAADVEVRHVWERWGIDDAYKAHEVGDIDFEAYAANLSRRLEIELSHATWLEGWNQLFVGTFGGVAAALAEVASNVPTFGYTNTNPSHQAEWQRRYRQTLEPFHKIYVSSEIGRRKPDVESFLWVAEDIGVDPSEILFLDDSRENVEGAEAAGMKTVHVTGPDVTESALRSVLRGRRG